MKSLGIYVHIPFCHRRCNYCGFYSKVLGKDNLEKVKRDKYVEWLIGKIAEESEKYRNTYVVDTIFIGGGTPSVLSTMGIEAILGTLREKFLISSEAEITIEANPESLDSRILLQYKNAGINRLSLGVQSFDDKILNRLGRIHDSEKAKSAYYAARKAGFNNINLDLMFGLPGQTFKQWKDTLEEAIKLEPDHISLYSLQIEENTKFYDEYVNGTLDMVTEKMDRKMYHYGISYLKDAGYNHYEISNFSKYGMECRHNLKYWSFQEYLGFGDSASSFIQGVRFTEKPIEERHINDFEDNTGEYVFTGLRKMKGISKKHFKETFGKEFWSVYGERKKYLEEFFQSGALIEEGDTLRISECGIDISNTIMAIFV